MNQLALGFSLICDDAVGMSSTYNELIDLLDRHGADYQLIDHAPVGATDEVSALRRHPPEQAAKCLLLLVKVDRHTRRHVLAVVPGDSKIDLGALSAEYGARYAGFVDPDTAERLARTVPGTVLPFPMHQDVDLVVDPRVLDQPFLYFNAARLDRSVRLLTSDYAAIAHPRLVSIAAVPETST